MHLDPRGVVRACCQNTWHRLGDLGSSSLTEIWHGAAARELRDRLAADDLSLGCEQCAFEMSIGADAAAYRHQFDDLPRVGSDLGWPRQLELALSISCNLQCVMCNGELSSSIRIHREGRRALEPVYGDAFFEELDSFLPHLDRITFLGGEPFLGAEPLRVMDRLIESGLRPTCHVNTNGTQWGPRVQRIVRELPLHLAVSVDGYRATTIEAIRVGVDAERLRANIGEMRDECRREGHGFVLTFCLMPDNFRELPDVLAWADEMDCDVFVNTVTSPPRYSLHHAAPGILGSIEGEMSALDAGAARRLGRNSPVWRQALDHVRSLVAARRVAAPPGAGDPQVVARLLAEAASDSAVGPLVVDAGDDLLIASVSSPSDALGPEVGHLVGQPLITLLETVGPAWGTLVATSLELAPGGVEVRRFTYRRDGVDRTLLAAMARRRGGETWFLSAVDRP